MNLEKVIKILEREVKNFKTPVVELIKLRTKNPFKVLVSTILSSRTKDEVTIKASKRLFSKVNKPSDLKKLSLEELQELIYPVGFYKTKAKHLKKLPKFLKKGVPNTREKLMELPGVGRKTANIVLNASFQKDVIAVDTHVHRITNRWGLVKTKTPKKTEIKLMKKLPRKYWKNFNYLLVVYGQNVCKPISPHCNDCKIKDYCKKVGVKKSR